MYFFHDTVGFIHLVSAIISMITGTMILVMKKGTLNHKRVGYVYVAAMAAVLITAFMIYRLWGGWGLFHYAALVSSVTLLGGMIPILFKYPKDSYIAFHFSFMYWSVMGLYGAFFAEIMTRLPSMLYDGPPDALFFQILSVTVGLVMALGGYYFYRNKDRWEREFR
ncbi:MAG: DUF2306 domain-containing protein [Bacteroidetes bacterium]|jgi:uncharacterized membrane protein|nr:DUF2306 domain-containing protein [Bacteroidota bacterium]